VATQTQPAASATSTSAAADKVIPGSFLALVAALVGSGYLI
jgi:hypothetical protein